MKHDSELLLLTTIHERSGKQKEISQRDLSRAINMSLGMTNVLVKRLTLKGLIIMKKVSPRNVTYVLTPDGMNELAKRTYRYLKRTMKQVVIYKEKILSIAQSAHASGCTSLTLVGESDIAFIVEYAARHLEMGFQHCIENDQVPDGSFVFVSEAIPDKIDTLCEQESIYIRELFMGDV